MNTQDLKFSFLLAQTPDEVFNAITNVREWWSGQIEGLSQSVNDEFIYRYKDLHYSKQRLVEVVPNKKVVWLITESNLSFVDPKDEWTGTNVIFEISKEGNKTLFTFTHVGLVPGLQCFEACSGGWGYYINKSLRQLIEGGVGEPDKLDSQVVEKNEIIQN